VKTAQKYADFQQSYVQKYVRVFLLPH